MRKLWREASAVSLLVVLALCFSLAVFTAMDKIGLIAGLIVASR